MTERYQLVAPGSRLDWKFDWSDWLGVGDSIASHQWSIAPLNNTTPETPTLSNSTTDTVTHDGLEAGKVYRLKDHITTAAGFESERTITIRCGPI